MKKQLIYLSSLMVVLSSCNSGGSTSSDNVYHPPLPTNLVGPGNIYKCMPDIDGDSASIGYKIAYGNNCEVSKVTDSNVRSGLESMAIAITNESGGRYCTGTPLSYNADDNTGYVLSAAHCVVGGSKLANKLSNNSNIITFDPKTIEVDGIEKTIHLNYVNQTTHAFSGSGATGKITAIYIPEQYCFYSEINDDGCEDLTKQNGDIALFKVKYDNGVHLDSKVKLAKSSFTMSSPSFITALGYGKTNLGEDGGSNTKLYYITYEYFGTNSYQGINSNYTLMNGYSINNAFYSVICGGDSGGGDFYWDGSHWQLVGVHSYGPSVCGYASYNYHGNDVSADVRPFTTYLKNIMGSTQSGDGCDNTLAKENGFVCRDEAN